MRLRYLHLQGLPPLTDLRVRFGHEPVLGRKVAIRFVVGVNGSGKTRLLQALTQIFLSLERPEFPPFPVTLAYDLHEGGQSRTIYLRHQPGDSSRCALIEFARELDINDENEWETLLERLQSQPGIYPIKGEPYMNGALPGSGTVTALLPSALLAYTSGATSRWQDIFTPDITLAELLPDEIGPDIERPMDWDLVAEKRYKEEIGEPLPENSRGESSVKALSVGARSFRSESIGQLVMQDSLKLAVCAVTLCQAVEDFRRIRTEGEESFFKDIEEAKTGLRMVLNSVDWLYPVTIGLRIRLEHEKLSRRESSPLTELFDCATTVIRDPIDQPGRLVLFDLQRLLPGREAEDTTTGAALIDALGQKDAPEPFDIFRTLQNWREIGLLENISITLRKHHADDLLLYDWLSDGEKMFLGRMALLHLFKRKGDALIILDEPETHFNDYWKRQLVDIIDDNLRDVASEVIISTHSSIALTDVFDTEITLLKKKKADGSIYADFPAIQTFGASPSEIMRKVFEAPDIVGQRANEFLDMALKVAAYPSQVETIWRVFESLEQNIVNGAEEDAFARVSKSDEFQNLWEMVRIIHPYENSRRLFKLLASLWHYTRRENPELSAVRVVDVLRMLEEKIGPGYYHFELNRRLQALEEMEPGATQS
jgi:energy-coupling factor transporter ATP-binding protein EcfA2